MGPEVTLVWREVIFIAPKLTKIAKNRDFFNFLKFLFFKVNFDLELGRNSKIGLRLAHNPGCSVFLQIFTALR